MYVRVVRRNARIPDSPCRVLWLSLIIWPENGRAHTWAQYGGVEEQPIKRRASEFCRSRRVVARAGPCCPPFPPLACACGACVSLSAPDSCCSAGDLDPFFRVPWYAALLAGGSAEPRAFREGLASIGLPSPRALTFAESGYQPPRAVTTPNAEVVLAGRSDGDTCGYRGSFPGSFRGSQTQDHGDVISDDGGALNRTGMRPMVASFPSLTEARAYPREAATCEVGSREYRKIGYTRRVFGTIGY